MISKQGNFLHCVLQEESKLVPFIESGRFFQAQLASFSVHDIDDF